MIYRVKYITANNVENSVMLSAWGKNDVENVLKNYLNEPVVILSVYEVTSK